MHLQGRELFLLHSVNVWLARWSPTNGNLKSQAMYVDDLPPRPQKADGLPLAQNHAEVSSAARDWRFKWPRIPCSSAWLLLLHATIDTLHSSLHSPVHSAVVRQYRKRKTVSAYARVRQRRDRDAGGGCTCRATAQCSPPPADKRRWEEASRSRRASRRVGARCARAF